MFSRTAFVNHAARERRARSRGFTAIEVLIAMTIMIIGAAAIMSMQKASVQGNLDSRRTDVANSIARTWVERLRMDSLRWTLPSPTNPTGNNLANAKILNNVGNGWFLPKAYMTGAAPETMSYAFDILGRDLLASDVANNAAQFCVEVNLTWLVINDLMRADVRVTWPRGITSTPDKFCSASFGATVPDPTVYHAIYVTTSIKQNPAP